MNERFQKISEPSVKPRSWEIQRKGTLLFTR